MGNLIFKGIQQVLASGFTQSTAESGVLYFVRNAATNDADIYFGKKHYGSLNVSKLGELEAAINTNNQNIKAINDTLGAWAASFQGDIKTVAAAVVAVSGTSEENKSAIATLTGTGEGSVAKAVADAKSDLEGKIQEVADSVESKNVSAEGDEYVSATAGDNKVIVSATEKTKASLALANSALQAADKEELEGKITVVDNKVTAFTETFETYTGNTAQTLGGLRTDVNAVSAATLTNTAKIEALINSEGVDAAIESFNELNKWIEEHGTAAENMLTAITANATAISAETKARNEALTSLESTLKGYADQAEADAYAAATAYTEGVKTELSNGLTAYTATTKTTLDTLRSDVNTVSGAVANHVTATTEAIRTAKEEAINAASAYTDNAITGEANARTQAFNTLSDAVDTKLDINTYKTYTGTTYSVLEDIRKDLTTITSNAVTSIASTGKTITVVDTDGAVNVEVNTLAHAESGQDGYVILNKTNDGALYGVMYYGGDDAE